MQEIQLTQGKVALVDDEEYERANAHKWQARWNPKTKSFYAVRRSPDGLVFMHNSIMHTPAGLFCDHRDHDTLNNQKKNLRNCTASQNSMNRRRQANNTSGVAGVRKSRNSYRAVVTANRKVVFDKCFHSIEEAARARNEAAKKHHGEFANLE